MQRFKYVVKQIWGDIVFIAMGLLFSIIVLALMFVIGWGLHLLFTTPWILDGTNPRYGG